MNGMSNISVIICTKDRIDELNRIFRSLDRQTKLPDELIIVDASLDDKTAKLVQNRSYFSKYSIKYIKSPPGLTTQRNIGIKASSGKYIQFFDDDVVLDDNYILVVYKTFQKFKGQKIGGITGRIVNNHDKRSAFDILIKKLFFLTEYGKGRLKLSGFPAHRNDAKLSFVNVLSGCCMAFNRKVFTDYLFDEKLSGYSYMEDVDLSYRVSKGYNLIYQPAAKLKHLSETYKISDTRSLRKMMVQNHLYLFKKNLPKNIAYIFAFALSILGLVLYNALFLKDYKACKGIFEGLISHTSRIRYITKL